MRKILVLLFLLVSVIAEGRKISESEAAAIAYEFLNSNVRQTPAKAEVRRAEGRKAENTGDAPFYVFNAENNQGFVIVSGDDRTQRILGYSDTGSFDFNNLPPQLDAILEQYAEQLKNIPSDTQIHDSWKAPAQNSEKGGVLLETANWGQGYPYNLKTPIIDGEHCPTGCVATAMAIVMKYHNWPATYNWADLSSEIGNGIEIASLLHDIGTKINTIYAANESSAFVGPIPQYFYSEFDYDGDCQLITRSNFTDDEYLSYIKTELNEGRPVISIGSGSSGTHCFIFDGYDIDAMLHVNWGWDGIANGFYTLDSLIPDSRDFSNNNGIIIGLQPATSQSIEYSDYAYMDAGYGINCICLQSGGGLSMDCENVTKNEDFIVTYSTLNIKSDINWGFALIDSSNNIKEIAADSLNFSQTEKEKFFYPLIGIENKICFHSEISENDRLAIVARRQILSDPWKIVRGTIEAPSIIPAKGYNPPLASLIWNLDDNMEITLHHGREKQTYNSQTVPIKMLKGTFLDIMVSSENPGVVVLECDGVKYGRDINTYWWTYYQHKNGIGGSIDIINNQYKISAHLVPIEDCDDHVYVNVVTPGTLSEVIKSDKLITGLTISGSINDYDFEFLRSRDERVLYLKKLDISNVSIYDKDGVLTNILPEHALEHHGFIQELVLPNNLREIADNALFHVESLKEISIPKSVTKIGRNALAYNVLLRKIIVNNPEAFEIDPLAFDELFFTVSELILSVPIGAKPNYLKHSGLWSKFGKIVEGNKSADAMTLKVSRNSENLKADNFLNYVHGHSIDILVEFSPKDAADYFYTWSSNPEYSFPNPRTNYLNGDVRFTIEDDFTKEEGQSTFFVESSSGQKQSFIVNSYPKFKSFTITPKEISLNENEEIKLTTNILPEYVYTPYIKWSSSDNAIAEVVNGHVYAHSSGSAIVTALIPDGSGISGSGTSATCEITVKKTKILVSSISLTPVSATGKTGEQIQISAAVLPENASNKDILWSSSDETVATVDNTGLITLITLGQATITASATDGSGVSATCEVVVTVATGIDDILSDTNTYVKVFNLSGVLVYEGIYSKANLAPGFYIVKYNGKNIKVNI